MKENEERGFEMSKIGRWKVLIKKKIKNKTTIYFKGVALIKQMLNGAHCLWWCAILEFPLLSTFLFHSIVAFIILLLEVNILLLLQFQE